jgi:hypothetical protein
MEGTKQIAQRIVNAENSFIENIMNIAKIDKAAAEKVLTVYKKLKIVKLNATIGNYTVKHGAFLDKDTILNAVAY